MSTLPRPPAVILILGDGSFETARRIQAALPDSQILGLQGRVTRADQFYDSFGAALRGAFSQDRPVIALCAAGIIIRSLAPLLQNKRAEPPVLAVAEDGSAVVPLLGGLRGVNDLARTLGTALATVPAITTSGEIRFNLTLEHPPAGYSVGNPDAGKRFMADLLSGATVKIVGSAPWLAKSRIPHDPAGTLTLTVTPFAQTAHHDEILFHPRCAVLAWHGDSSSTDPAHALDAIIAQANLVPTTIAALALAATTLLTPLAPALRALAQARGWELRIVDRLDAAPHAAALLEGLPLLAATTTAAVALAGEDPAALALPGHRLGSVTVVGLGPGKADLLPPAARQAVERADDIIGYFPYVEMAGPYRASQTLHASDNRVEMDRARLALRLATEGRHAVIVSSGDPGIFAMATAVMEALDPPDHPLWAALPLEIIPGISAAQMAASVVGAPLGHDFAILSLSDNLKPWEVMTERLALATKADLVLAFYNPISRARPWQLGEALDIVRAHRPDSAPVILGRQVGRPDQTVTVTTLGAVTPAMVDMKTVVLIGSSQSRVIPRLDAVAPWVYTPRWYPRPVIATKDEDASDSG